MSPGFISEFLFIYSIIMTCIGIQITFAMIRVSRKVFPEKDFLIGTLSLGESRIN